jgi:hypothetical protein
MVTKNDSQVFEEICCKFEANNDAEALQDLRDLASRVDDPWDRAWLNYQESDSCILRFRGPDAR